MGIFHRLQKIHDKTYPHCAMIVAAAGSSSRMGENKLFMPLAGVPVLMRTLRAVDAAAMVDEIVIAAREEDMLAVADLCARSGLNKPVKVVKGGQSRMESVLCAAMECDPKTEVIAVHDGARPLVQPSMVDELIRQGNQTYAVAPAIPVSDTIKVADAKGTVQGTPDRKSLFAVQTPQVFQSSLLKAALQSAMANCTEVTDDCSAVEMIGKEVYLTEGDRENIKITTPVDIVIAEAILRKRGQIL